MNNVKYFKYSQDHADILKNNINPEGKLVINRNEMESETPLMTANTKLIELITTYKTIRNDPSFNESCKLSIIDDVIKIIETTELINYSPFCVYLQVVGYSFDKYKREKKSISVEEKQKLFEKLVNLYIDNRHNVYLYHGYSNQVLQVNSDASSSRRKGKLGIEIVENILNQHGLKRATKFYELVPDDNYYLLPDKGDIHLFNSFLETNKIVFDFRKSRDNKNPDMLIKINGNYYMLEHKLTNGSGGSQNAEINEIIQFINYSETNENWHYVSCLQGDFFNKLSTLNNEPKTQNQYNNILSNLYNNPGNFFVNGNGLTKLISDLTKIKPFIETNDAVIV